MRQKIILGNWKMNVLKNEAKTFFNTFGQLLENEGMKTIKGIEYGFAVPSVLFETINELKKRNKNLNQLIISSQNINANDFGAFTGEINAAMLKDSDIKYTLIGHSERRLYYNEKNTDINEKAKSALANGITPVICFGETEEQFEKGITKEVVSIQLKVILKDIDVTKVILAYEPIWAIGTGKTAAPKRTQDMAKYIRSMTHKNAIIQYGGSVKPSNIGELMAMPDVDGALVGGASLDPKSFFRLLTLNK